MCWAQQKAFEDLGVSAYNGAGKLIENADYLLLVGKIVSVEARHASMVRRLRAEKGWISGSSRGSLPSATQAVYDGEDNVTQGGANVTTLGYSAQTVTEAFDEPLAPDKVLAIAGLFIKK